MDWRATKHTISDLIVITLMSALFGAATAVLMGIVLELWPWSIAILVGMALYIWVVREAT